MLNKILAFYTKYFAIWVVIFGVIAYQWDEYFTPLRPGMDYFFALTMFGIGAVLTVEDFKQIAEKPWIVLIGSAAQFTIMPLGAFAVARLLHLSPMVTVGLVLTGSAPGAMASNVMCYVGKADTAYSVSLTTVSTLLCPILTPALTYVLARSTMDVPVLKMMIHVSLVVILPLLLGFAVRHILGKRIECILPLFPAISVTFIIFICSLVIALNKSRLGNITVAVVAAVLILNLYGMSAGYGAAALFRMQTRRRRTLSIEIGMQNAGLGANLALAHFGAAAALPAAIFVFTCIITASIMATLWQRADARPSTKSP